MASLNFPTLPRFGGALFPELKDRELADVCVKAWNDFMSRRVVCGRSGHVHTHGHRSVVGRRTGREGDREESGEGLRAITIPEETSLLGLPSYYDSFWDPVWDICEQSGTAVCMHIGSSGWRPYTPPESNPSLMVALGFVPTITHASGDDVQPGASKVPRHQDRLLGGRDQLGARCARAC